jgi:hypothetical protein
MKARSPVAAALVAVMALMGGCSSSKSSESTTATQPTTASSAAPAATQPTSSTTSTASTPGAATTQPSTAATTAAPSSADDTTAITAAFTKFFDGLDPNVDAKIALLEHGDVLGSMITDAAQNPQFQQLTTVVNSVTVLSDADCAAAAEVAPCAAVGHDMFIGGLPAMVGLKSHAVKVNGVWKVSATSWCAIVTLGGATCPAIPKG